MKKKNYENYKNLNKTMNIKIITAFIFGAVISIASSYALAETLIKSSDVSYVDNSKLGATNVQAAIDGTCTKFSNDLQSFLLKVYPVGSIYISYNSTNPGTLFGGTWENYGNGRVLKGINIGTAGTTGGSETVTLSMSNIPAHTHDISHTHTTPQTNTTTLSLTAQSNGGHSHTIGTQPDESIVYDHVQDVFHMATNYTRTWYFNGTGYGQGSTSTEGAHTHSVTGSVTVPTMITNSISTSTSGSAGSSNPTAINVQDPYITVYMWRRTK